KGDEEFVYDRSRCAYAKAPATEVGIGRRATACADRRNDDRRADRYRTESPRRGNAGRISAKREAHLSGRSARPSGEQRSANYQRYHGAFFKLARRVETRFTARDSRSLPARHTGRAATGCRSMDEE